MDFSFVNLFHQYHEVESENDGLLDPLLIRDLRLAYQSNLPSKHTEWKLRDILSEGEKAIIVKDNMLINNATCLLDDPHKIFLGNHPIRSDKPAKYLTYDDLQKERSQKHEYGFRR